MSGPVFNAGAIEAKAKIDRSEFVADLRRMQSDIRAFQRTPIELNAKIDRAAIRRDLRALKQEISNAGDAKLSLSINTAQAKRDIAAFRAYVRGLSPATMSFGLNVGQARRDVAEFRAYVRNLATTNLKVGANTTDARREVAALKKTLGGTVHLRVDAQTLAALAGLQQVNNARQRLDGSRANVNLAIGSDAGRVIGMIGLITAGVSAISYLAPAAGAALAGMFATAGSGIQLVGALGFGLSGVGDAYKAMSQESQRAATEVGKSNSGISSALRSVDDARRSAAHTASTSLRSVEDAERSLSEAVDDATYAQEALNDARAEEIRQLDELKERVRDFALDQEGAAIKILEAEEDLRITRELAATGKASPLDMRKAEYDLAVARERQRDLTREEAEATKELDEVNRVGIEGSDRVVDAKRRVADANERIEDAQRSLRRSQEDAAYSQQEANRAIIDALARVQEAHSSAANAGVGGANKVQYAMSQLSPEGQEFVKFLYEDMRPALNEIGDSVQGAMLPDMQKAMEELLGLQPEIQTGLTGTGRVIGRLSLAGANMATSGPFRRDFASIMAGNNRMLENMGTAGIFLTGSMTSVYAVSQPIVEEWTQWALQSSALFASWVEGKRASGELAQYFELAADRAEELWDVFVQLVTTAYDLGVALAPVGSTVLDIVTAGLEFLSWVAKTSPEMLQLIAYSTLAFAAFINIGKAILSVGAATRLGIAGFGRLIDLVNGAALSAGVLTERWTGNAAAGQAVANAGSKVGSALTKIGHSLPIVGAALVIGAIAWDSYVFSLDEATAALLHGGEAADKALEKLESQTRVVEAANSGWVTAIPIIGSWAGIIADKLIPTTEDATRAMEAEFNALSTLEQAKVRVAQATNRHSDAMKEYGPSSAQAAQSSAVLAFETGRLKEEQEKAAYAAQTYTDKLIEQRNVMLGTIDAEIQYEDALDRLTESVNTNGASINLNTEAGRENRRALNDLARAAIEHLDQLKQQGASLEDVAFKEQQYKDQLYNSAIQIGMTKDQARQYVEQLHLVPGVVPTTMLLNTDPATKALVEWMNTVQGQQFVLTMRADTGNILNQARATGAIDFIAPMAAGGLRSMAAGIANVVSPNTPTLIGDNKRFNESYIPHDRTSSRAQRIYDITGMALGRTANRARGMADGGVVSGFDTGTGTTPAVDKLTEDLITLRTKGFDPLIQQITDLTVPTLESLQKKTDEDLTRTFINFGILTKDTWQFNTDNVTTGVNEQIKQHNFLTDNYGNMQSVIGQQTAIIRDNHLRGLQDGMHVTAQVGENVSRAVGDSFGRMRAYAADPIRWMISWPFNAGLVTAWNEIDKFFALGRPMNTLPIAFEQGGGIHGGIPNKDSVLIKAMAGEFVMPKPMVADFGGIENLERARIASLGGTFRSHGLEGMGNGLSGFAVGGAVDNAMAFAKAQVGKPYVWGATGPSGYDCSGLWSAIQNSLFGRNPYSRLFTTSSFSRSSGAAGLIPGLGSTFTVGVEPGHMGGTLAGTAFEATPPRVRTSPSARGTTNFPMHFFLPQAGGQFVDSGPAGGIDVGAIVQAKMAHAIRMANDLTGFFGQGSAATSAKADGLASINNVIRWAMSNISGATSVVDASGPVVEQVRSVAARYGWDMGNEWDAIQQIVAKESSWNPNAANPSSSARGLFQKMTSIHGPVESTPAGQAEWGLKYIQERYGTPSSALRFHNTHGWYAQGGEVKLFDNGGWLKPNTFGFNASTQPEAVLTKEQLTTVRDEAGTPVIGTVVMNLPYGASPQEYVETLDFELQYRRKKGVYKR